METKHPYPTEIELIRFISNVLDLQTNKKKIDDNIYDTIINPQKIDELYLLAIFKPLEKIVGKELAEIIKKDIDVIKTDYIKLIVTASAEFLLRKNICDILIKDFFAIHIVNILQNVWKNLKQVPHPIILFSANCYSVNEIIKWLECHDKKWHSECNQDNYKSKVYAWKTGENIPSTQSIKSLKMSSSSHLLLLLASAIERLKKLPHGLFLVDEIRINLWLPSVPSIAHDNIQKKFISLRRPVLERLNEDFYFSYLNIDEKLKGEKSSNDKNSIENDLNHLEALYEQSPQIMTLRAHIDWLWARFFLLSGELNKAYEFYQKLIDSFIYTGGENQKLILKEALVIAANLPNTDIFIKKLKWAMLTFNYDIPSVDGNPFSNKFADNVQVREIEMWKHHIYDLFPRELFFPECRINLSPTKVGALIESNKEKIKPDYRNPNRQIKMGNIWSKKMPQLIYFMLKRQFDIVKRLLEEGANVNVKSEANETPIMIALDFMDIFSCDMREPDERFFNLISQHKHTQEMVNLQSEKRKLLPIMLAVETGKTDIVEKILNFGANPNIIASCDWQSPLYLSLNCIYQIKNPNELKNTILQQFSDNIFSLYDIDAIKRYSNGSSLFFNEQFQSDQRKKGYNSEYQKILEIVCELFINKMSKYGNAENFRKIAKLLINKGADVNGEHIQPIKGYTPFMYAAELDELELFQYMYKHGGDLDKTYRDKLTNKDVGIKDIASYFKSQNVLNFLNNSLK